MEASWRPAPGPAFILGIGGTLLGEDHGTRTTQGTELTVLAGGGGRLAAATVRVVYTTDGMICGSCTTRTEPIPGTAVVSLLGSRSLEEIAAGEQPLTALAIDAGGLVWATTDELRAADR
jgi:hypothetical protein